MKLNFPIVLDLQSPLSDSKPDLIPKDFLNSPNTLSLINNLQAKQFSADFPFIKTPHQNTSSNFGIDPFQVLFQVK